MAASHADTGSEASIEVDPGVYDNVVVLTAAGETTTSRRLEATPAYEHELPTTVQKIASRNEWEVLRFTGNTIWLTPETDQSVALMDVEAEFEEFTGYEYTKTLGFEWVSVVPGNVSTPPIGHDPAYFARLNTEPGYLYNGIECAADTTPPGIADMQRELIRVFDATRSPEAVCQHLDTQAGCIRDSQLIAADIFFREEQLLNAAVTVLSPVDWWSGDIEEYLDDTSSSEDRTTPASTPTRFYDAAAETPESAAGRPPSSR